MSTTTHLRVSAPAYGFDIPVSTTTRTGHVVTTVRTPQSIALFETRVRIGGKQVHLADDNRETDAAETHAQVVEKFGGAPVEAPEGLTAAEYVRLAIDCLDQAGLSRHGQLAVATTLRDFLDNDARTCRLVGDGLEEVRSTVGAMVDDLRRAS